MQRILAALAFVCAVILVSAQAPLHDYLVLEFDPHPLVRQVLVDVSSGEQRIIKLKEQNGKSMELDMRTVLGFVQEYEQLGWSLFQVSMPTSAGTGVEDRMLWIMRKPKQ